jgi:hypothetical protein
MRIQVYQAFFGILVFAQYFQALAIEYYGEPSPNFVIRWAFQQQCDWVFDPRTVWPSAKKDGQTPSFNPKEVKKGDLIFVRDADTFFKYMHKKIEVPYFILTHGEYLDMFKEHYFKYLEDSKILAWFTIHPCERKHERVIPMALGIIQYNELYSKRYDVEKKFAKLRTHKKDKLIYQNFTDWHNPERTRIRDLFINKGFCTNAGQKPFETYIVELAQHKFVISPPGLGPDCYRVWESLLVGTIPLVKHSHLDFLYEGLPVLFIDKWEDVTEQFLMEKYQEMTSKKYSIEKLYMEYWLKIISDTRIQFLARYNAQK